jgi:hypothetical protein
MDLALAPLARPGQKRQAWDFVFGASTPGVKMARWEPRAAEVLSFYLLTPVIAHNFKASCDWDLGTATRPSHLAALESLDLDCAESSIRARPSVARCYAASFPLRARTRPG